MAGLEECVRTGYLDQPESIVPLANPSLLGELAPTLMKERGDRGFLGFGVFVAWCSDLRRGAIADFPEVDTRADQDPEVTILARCLDTAITAPSWSRYASPRLGRVLAERVSGRIGSEVPDLVDLAQAAQRGPDGPPSSAMWDGLALSAIRRWQDAVLDEVEGMGAANRLWYRVLDAWRAARMVTGRGPCRSACCAGWRRRRRRQASRGGGRAWPSRVGARFAWCTVFPGRMMGPLLQVDANEASEHHGAIQVTTTLLGLERGAVAGYWRRRKEQCRGWPLFHRLPVIEMFLLSRRALIHIRAMGPLRV